MKLLAPTLGLALAAGPVLAGNPVPVAPEPAPIAPAPVATNTGGDWTGGYVGLQFGNASVEADGGNDGDDLIYGAHIGYDYDFGTFVLGGELEYDAGPVDIGAADVDSVTRLKLRAGYDLGSTLLYLTAGPAQVDTSLGDGDGWFGGIGFAYQVTPSWTVGAEYLMHEFDDIGGTGIDADADTISLRASFRF